MACIPTDAPPPCDSKEHRACEYARERQACAPLHANAGASVDANIDIRGELGDRSVQIPLALRSLPLWIKAFTVDVYSHRLPQIDFLSVALPRCLPQTLHHLSDAVRTT